MLHLNLMLPQVIYFIYDVKFRAQNLRNVTKTVIFSGTEKNLPGI